MNFDDIQERLVKAITMAWVLIKCNMATALQVNGHRAVS